jgi:uncharacterized damage-inducible protein DinB
MTGDQAKFFAEQVVGTLRQEFATTVKVLEAVNEEKRDYRPDPKSRSAWDLARHIATADVWFLSCALDGKFVSDPAAQKAAEEQFSNVAEVVAFYKKAFGAALDRAAAASGDDLARTVDFFGMMQLPAVSFLMLTNNHSIHHRGQLSAYLRASGSKVPDIYGPSGDSEKG